MDIFILNVLSIKTELVKIRLYAGNTEQEFSYQSESENKSCLKNVFFLNAQNQMFNIIHVTVSLRLSYT